MKVSELIKILSSKDPEQNVILHGYEGGFYFAHGVEEMKIALNVNDPEEWWYGPHEDLDSYAYEREVENGRTFESVDVLLIR